MDLLDSWQVTALDAATVPVDTYVTSALGTVSKEGVYFAIPESLHSTIDRIVEEKNTINASIRIRRLEQCNRDSQYFVIVKEARSPRSKVLYPERIDRAIWRIVCERGTASAKRKPLSQIYDQKELRATFTGLGFMSIGLWYLTHGLSKGPVGMLLLMILLSGLLIVVSPAFSEWRRVSELKHALGMLKIDLGDD